MITKNTYTFKIDTSDLVTQDPSLPTFLDISITQPTKLSIQFLRFKVLIIIRRRSQVSNLNLDHKIIVI